MESSDFLKIWDFGPNKGYWDSFWPFLRYLRLFHPFIDDFKPKNYDFSQKNWKFYKNVGACGAKIWESHPSLHPWSKYLLFPKNLVNPIMKFKPAENFTRRIKSGDYPNCESLECMSRTAYSFGRSSEDLDFHPMFRISFLSFRSTFKFSDFFPSLRIFYKHFRFHSTLWILL